jgi:hypothetical protein
VPFPNFHKKSKAYPHTSRTASGIAAFPRKE